MGSSKHSGDLHQYVKGYPITLERNTGRVPDDGRYYILDGGEVMASYKRYHDARDKFMSLLQQRGYVPHEGMTKPRESTQYGLERYLDAKEEYWSESYKHRCGGKLRHR